MEAYLNLILVTSIVVCGHHLHNGSYDAIRKAQPYWHATAKIMCPVKWSYRFPETHSLRQPETARYMHAAILCSMILAN